MTTPSTEQQNLDQLMAVLAQAQYSRLALSAVAEVLSSFADVAELAVEALMSMPGVPALIRELPALPSGAHPARLAMNRQNLMRRASYLVSAARRLTTGVRTNQLRDAVEREKRYFGAHLDAIAKRSLAANAVAAEAEKRYSDPDGDLVGPSQLLGWYATLDARTSAECRRAHGRNFDPTRIPRIGFPGAVHPHCRCKPGPAFRSGDRVENLPAIDEARMTEIAASHPARDGWVVSFLA